MSTPNRLNINTMSNTATVSATAGNLALGDAVISRGINLVEDGRPGQAGAIRTAAEVLTSSMQRNLRCYAAPNSLAGRRARHFFAVRPAQIQCIPEFEVFWLLQQLGGSEAFLSTTRAKTLDFVLQETCPMEPAQPQLMRNAFRAGKKVRGMHF